MSPTDMEPYQKRIEERLAERLSEISCLALREPLASLVAGGKRVRSIVTLLACEAAGGDVDAALPASVGVELLHAASLIHDDIMDRASLRRGRPTVQAAYGINTALLSGDYLVALAYEEMFRCPVNSRQSILNLTNRTYRMLCEGQALEDALSAESFPSEDKMLEVIEKKTASLMELASCAGALAAGVAEKHLGPYARFGRMLGISFQIQDDILDLKGVAEEMGKETFLDSRNNKWTYARLEGGRNAPAPGIENTALVPAADRCQYYMDQAVAALRDIPSSEARDRLCRFALSLAGRRK